MATHDKGVAGELPAPAGGLGRGVGLALVGELPAPAGALGRSLSIALGKAGKTLHYSKSVRGFWGPISSTLGRAIGFTVRGNIDLEEG